MNDLRARYDIAIIGGGLAGSTLAALLARAGREVLLLEKDTFPRDKLCGEFLSPESRRVLREIDVEDRIAPGAPQLSAARFSAPSGSMVYAKLPDAALGVSRLKLDAALFDAAARSGAEARSGHQVVDLEPSTAGVELEVRADGASTRTRADIVVGAYGRRTRLDRIQERSFMDQRHPYVGFKRHHRPSDSTAGRRTDDTLAGHVEIHGFEGGYCGMSHIETGEVNVCMLLEQSMLSGIGEANWDDIATAIARENPVLANRLAGLEPSEDGMHAVAQVPFVLKSAFRNRVFFCGDSAGMIAPLTGDGQAMALESAMLLSDILLELPATPGRDEIAAAGKRWSRRWRLRYEPRLRLGRQLQRLLFRRKPLEIGIRIIDAVPGLADALARWTRSASEHV
jgi:flavin-dependent dehydrogenase